MRRDPLRYLMDMIKHLEDRSDPFVAMRLELAKLR
jgi:hypothetical protein